MKKAAYARRNHEGLGIAQGNVCRYRVHSAVSFGMGAAVCPHLLCFPHFEGKQRQVSHHRLRRSHRRGGHRHGTCARARFQRLRHLHHAHERVFPASLQHGDQAPDLGGQARRGRSDDGIHFRRRFAGGGVHRLHRQGGAEPFQSQHRRAHRALQREFAQRDHRKRRFFGREDLQPAHRGHLHPQSAPARRRHDHLRR